jgi:thiamine-phosphate pyrophosphorylase
MLYAITNRELYGTDEVSCRQHLIDQTALWTANGVAFIQLREKDLSGREQVELARAMLKTLHAYQNPANPTHLLINGSPDVALAAGADGVHLPGGPEMLTADEVRKIFAMAGRTQPPIISVSCHTLQEVEAANRQKPNCILFAPVFEKVVAATTNPQQKSASILPGSGLELLKQACQLATPVPVFALGGVTAENAAQCLAAGAAGIAAIRLMQEPTSVWRHFV